MALRPGISVVIPNWNGEALLAEHLPVLIDAMRHSGMPHEIIVVDDCSTDGSVTLIKTTFPEIRLVLRESNGGFSRSANAGAAGAEYDKLLLLNSDIMVARGFLDAMLPYFADLRTFAVSNKGIDDRSGKSAQMYTMRFRMGLFREKPIKGPERPMFPMGASGGHGLFDTAKFRELGGFDELFSPFYWEDADLGYRAWKRGYRIYYEPRSSVVHRHQSTIGRLDKKYVQRIFFRNYLMLIWKNVTDWELVLQHVLLLPPILLAKCIHQPSVAHSFISALSRLPAIMRSRRIESSRSVVTDREVLALFDNPIVVEVAAVSPPVIAPPPVSAGWKGTTISTLVRLKHKAGETLRKDSDSFLSHVTGVIHIGANTGQERFRYWKHGLYVLWIEPIPEVFEVLKSNLVGFPRQRGLQCLVTDKEGLTYQFNVSNFNGESSSILGLKMHSEMFPTVNYVKTITLQSRTLASLVAEESLKPGRYNALVMDTQGSELLVLKGSLPILDQFAYIKTEVSDFELYAGCCQLDDISSFMTAHGFVELCRHSSFAYRNGKIHDVVYKRCSWP